MTGIDSTLGSVLASRIDTLIEGVGAGTRAAAAQTGASARMDDARPVPVSAADAAPPPSAQATLSEVALTLDAISRFGGEATPAVMGDTPIWPAPPAIDARAVGGAGLPTADPDPAANEAAAGSAAVSGSAASSASSANSPTSPAAVTETSAASVPVGALAAALEQTVADTGLFYESHLAQWLAGSYPADALVNEPQARLAAQSAAPAPGWASSASEGIEPPDAFFGALSGMPVLGLSEAPPSGAALPPRPAAAQLLASTLAGQARALAGAYSSVRQFAGLPAVGAEPDAARKGGGTLPRSGETLAGAPASMAASIHPATLPLVRQQLDLLATEQFRWTGEVWPGTKLDWTIEPERRRRSGAGAQPEFNELSEQAWRTRLTLALPTLGTVDADLVLTGTQLVVRVQASPTGAARLAPGGEAFGRRLRAAGIELAGLSIREVG
ncbi:MAG: hypothetical protein QOI13_3330, partial [Paraburkholderia sp.]|nr:hypothetical protein [Paraburkholderia sp.]